MPQFPLTEPELTALVAFLQWTSEIDTPDWPPQDAKARRTNQEDITFSQAVDHL